MTNLSMDPEVLRIRGEYADQLKLEDAIMALKGFDYDCAWEVFAALQAKLERVYEDRLNSDVEHYLKKLRAALEAA